MFGPYLRSNTPKHEFWERVEEYVTPTYKNHKIIILGETTPKTVQGLHSWKEIVKCASHCLVFPLLAAHILRCFIRPSQNITPTLHPNIIEGAHKATEASTSLIRSTSSIHPLTNSDKNTDAAKPSESEPEETRASSPSSLPPQQAPTPVPLHQEVTPPKSPTYEPFAKGSYANQPPPSLPENIQWRQWNGRGVPQFLKISAGEIPDLQNHPDLKQLKALAIDGVVSLQQLHNIETALGRPLAYRIENLSNIDASGVPEEWLYNFLSHLAQHPPLPHGIESLSLNQTDPVWGALIGKFPQKKYSFDSRAMTPNEFLATLSSLVEEEKQGLAIIKAIRLPISATEDDVNRFKPLLKKLTDLLYIDTPHSTSLSSVEAICVAGTMHFPHERQSAPLSIPFSPSFEELLAHAAGGNPITISCMDGKVHIGQDLLGQATSFATALDKASVLRFLHRALTTNLETRTADEAEHNAYLIQQLQCTALYPTAIREFLRHPNIAENIDEVKELSQKAQLLAKAKGGELPINYPKFPHLCSLTPPLESLTVTFQGIEESLVLPKITFASSSKFFDKLYREGFQQGGQNHIPPNPDSFELTDERLPFTNKDVQQLKDYFKENKLPPINSLNDLATIYTRGEALQISAFATHAQSQLARWIDTADTLTDDQLRTIIQASALTIENTTIPCTAEMVTAADNEILRRMANEA